MTWLLLLTTLGLCYLPGLALTRLIARHVPHDAIPAHSFLLSTLCLGIGGLIAYSQSIIPYTSFATSWIILSFTFSVVILGRDRHFLAEFWHALRTSRASLIVLLGLTILLALQWSLPTYEGGRWNYDWFESYHIVRAFAQLPHTEIELFARTPLYQLVQAMCSAPFGAQFSHYQIVHCVIITGLWCSLYSLVRGLSSTRTARLTLLLSMVLPWSLHGLWYPWSKPLCIAALFMCLRHYIHAWHTDNPRRSLLWSSACAGIATLAHPLAVFGCAGLSLDLLWKRCAGCDWNTRLRHAWHYIWPAALLVGLWLLFVIIQRSASDLVAASPAFGDSHRQSTAWLGIVLAQIHNAVASIIPVHIGLGLAQWKTLVASQWEQFQLLTEIYFNPMVGALGLSGSYACWKYWRAPARWYRVLTVIFSALCLLMLGFYFTIEHEQLFTHYLAPAYLPFCGLLLGLALWCAWRARRKSATRIPASAQLRSIRNFAIGSALGGIIIHPGIDWHGIAHNTMPQLVFLLIAACAYALQRAPRVLRSLWHSEAVLALLGYAWLFRYVVAGRFGKNWEWINDPSITLLSQTLSFAAAHSVALLALCGILTAHVWIARECRQRFDTA